MKAIANRPAVRSAIGVPCMAFGILFMFNCSLNPANSTNAKVKPKAVANAKMVPVSKLWSKPAGNLAVPLATKIATPKMQQFVVISGRNTPKA